ncbi:UNVERIFIED_CONTAM: hypothetical protein HHA_237160 [Hammondia hammondi]|eukprot:XP_008885431.1 hypothetical protein HHA_237160 [Hammondia hammondi]
MRPFLSTSPSRALPTFSSSSPVSASSLAVHRASLPAGGASMGLATPGHAPFSAQASWRPSRSPGGWGGSARAHATESVRREKASRPTGGQRPACRFLTEDEIARCLHRDNACGVPFSPTLWRRRQLTRLSGVFLSFNAGVSRTQAVGRASCRAFSSCSQGQRPLLPFHSVKGPCGDASCQPPASSSPVPRDACSSTSVKSCGLSAIVSSSSPAADPEAPLGRQRASRFEPTVELAAEERLLPPSSEFLSPCLPRRQRPSTAADKPGGSTAQASDAPAFFSTFSDSPVSLRLRLKLSFPCTPPSRVSSVAPSPFPSRKPSRVLLSEATCSASASAVSLSRCFPVRPVSGRSHKRGPPALRTECGDRFWGLLPVCTSEQLAAFDPASSSSVSFIFFPSPSGNGGQPSCLCLLYLLPQALQPFAALSSSPACIPPVSSHWLAACVPISFLSPRGPSTSLTYFSPPRRAPASSPLSLSQSPNVPTLSSFPTSSSLPTSSSRLAFSSLFVLDGDRRRGMKTLQRPIAAASRAQSARSSLPNTPQDTRHFPEGSQTNRRETERQETDHETPASRVGNSSWGGDPRCVHLFPSSSSVACSFPPLSGTLAQHSAVPHSSHPGVSCPEPTGGPSFSPTSVAPPHPTDSLSFSFFWRRPSEEETSLQFLRPPGCEESGQAAAEGGEIPRADRDSEEALLTPAVVVGGAGMLPQQLLTRFAFQHREIFRDSHEKREREPDTRDTEKDGSKQTEKRPDPACVPPSLPRPHLQSPALKKNPSTHSSPAPTHSSPPPSRPSSSSSGPCLAHDPHQSPYVSPQQSPYLSPHQSPYVSPHQSPLPSRYLSPQATPFLSAGRPAAGSLASPASSSSVAKTHVFSPSEGFPPLSSPPSRLSPSLRESGRKQKRENLSADGAALPAGDNKTRRPREKKRSKTVEPTAQPQLRAFDLKHTICQLIHIAQHSVNEANDRLNSSSSPSSSSLPSSSSSLSSSSSSSVSLVSSGEKKKAVRGEEQEVKKLQEKVRVALQGNPEFLPEFCELLSALAILRGVPSGPLVDRSLVLSLFRCVLQEMPPGKFTPTFEELLRLCKAAFDLRLSDASPELTLRLIACSLDEAQNTRSAPPPLSAVLQLILLTEDRGFFNFSSPVLGENADQAAELSNRLCLYFVARLREEISVRQQLLVPSSSSFLSSSTACLSSSVCPSSSAASSASPLSSPLSNCPASELGYDFQDFVKALWKAVAMLGARRCGEKEIWRTIFDGTELHGEWNASSSPPAPSSSSFFSSFSSSSFSFSSSSLPCSSSTFGGVTGKTSVTEQTDGEQEGEHNEVRRDFLRLSTAIQLIARASPFYDFSEHRPLLGKVFSSLVENIPSSSSSSSSSVSDASSPASGEKKERDVAEGRRFAAFSFSGVYTLTPQFYSADLFLHFLEALCLSGFGDSPAFLRLCHIAFPSFSFALLGEGSLQSAASAPRKTRTTRSAGKRGTFVRLFQVASFLKFFSTPPSPLFSLSSSLLSISRGQALAAQLRPAFFKSSVPGASGKSPFSPELAAALNCVVNSETCVEAVARMFAPEPAALWIEDVLSQFDDFGVAVHRVTDRQRGLYFLHLQPTNSCSESPRHALLLIPRCHELLTVDLKRLSASSSPPLPGAFRFLRLLLERQGWRVGCLFESEWRRKEESGRGQRQLAEDAEETGRGREQVAHILVRM